jgi:two-component system sensor histidine kinase PilS (NtrC family)
VPDAKNANTFRITAIHWKTLRYFSAYRLCAAALLVASSLFHIPTLSLIGREHGHQPTITGLYFLVNVISFIVMQVCQRHFNRQLTIQVLIDVLFLIWLAHVVGGLRNGLGVMLLVTLAGAGLVGQGNLALFYAAVATLTVLAGESLQVLRNTGDAADFFQAGLFCAGSFTVAISARLLANRVNANEELARQHGEALKNQMTISQHVIEKMQDGVIVLDREGHIKQHNPRIEQLLGLGDPRERKLSAYSTELAQGFDRWSARGGNEPVLIRAPASGMHLRARFIATESSEGDVLILLEDLGRLQEQSRQHKLAALGRLTANIAHEIRNPLSAINHAGELLREESTGPTGDRLVRIVLDNVQRVERIVNDVLELGRRDRARRDFIDLNQALPLFVEELAAKERVPDGVVQVEISGRALIIFDRLHFHQILWNLVGNALRHSRCEKGSIRLRVRDRDHEHGLDIHVIDDGGGVDEAHREQVFEPFFTTHSRGTGLGLYIARELCEANDARLELLDARDGADFCISGRSVE